jgi:hypothetical protein
MRLLLIPKGTSLRTNLQGGILQLQSLTDLGFFSAHPQTLLFQALQDSMRLLLLLSLFGVAQAKLRGSLQAEAQDLVPVRALGQRWAA